MGNTNKNNNNNKICSSKNTSNKSSSSTELNNQLQQQKEDEDEEGLKRIVLKHDYFIDEILDKDVKESRVMYKIKWLGYPLEKDHTWEPVSNINACMEYIKDYEERHSFPVVVDPKINLELVKRYRRIALRNDELFQIFGMELNRRVLLVKWDNSCLVTTLYVSVCFF